MGGQLVKVGAPVLYEQARFDVSSCFLLMRNKIGLACCQKLMRWPVVNGLWVLGGWFVGICQHAYAHPTQSAATAQGQGLDSPKDYGWISPAVHGCLSKFPGECLS